MSATEILPIILYLLSIILMGILIVIGIRLIQVFDRVERLMDNIEGKINSLNGIFDVINKTTLGFDLVTSRVVNSVIGICDKIFKRKKGKDDIYE